jgi:L-ascorbate metabolism protein UlaG (beta-lactamase superfamily)
MGDSMTKIENIDVKRGIQSTTILSAPGKTVFIDPYKMQDSGDKADIILITHDHKDHCDPESIERLRNDATVIVGPESCAKKIKGLKTIEPDESIEEDGVEIEAVMAYNKNHPKGKCLGFVVNLNGKRVYHAGDTDRIPEMKGLGSIDIALLPVGGTYTMTAEQAAAAANEDIKPKVAIPMHYGTVVGSVADARKFKKLCKCDVVIL